MDNMSIPKRIKPTGHLRPPQDISFHYTNENAPVRLVAHEVIHVLGEICIDRHITFTNEKEHMGYLMQYILGRIIGDVRY